MEFQPSCFGWFGIGCNLLFPLLGHSFFERDPEFFMASRLSWVIHRRDSGQPEAERDQLVELWTTALVTTTHVFNMIGFKQVLCKSSFSQPFRIVFFVLSGYDKCGHWGYSDQPISRVHWIGRRVTLGNIQYVLAAWRVNHKMKYHISNMYITYITIYCLFNDQRRGAVAPVFHHSHQISLAEGSPFLVYWVDLRSSGAGLKTHED